MLKLTTTSYLCLFNTLNFNIFVHKSRSNARGIQLVLYGSQPNILTEIPLKCIYACSLFYKRRDFRKANAVTAFSLFCN